MMGTLALVMAKKKIRTFRDRFMAKVTGDIEDVGGILKITRIDVRYLLKPKILAHMGLLRGENMAVTR
jgi:hypothetical protein